MSDRNGAVTMKDFANRQKPTWCPGCGDFGILTAIKGALVELQIAPWEALIVSGIGCGSKLPDYMEVNGFMTIHGRPLPIATGAKLANPDLHVIVVHGDGDAYGIGGNHFLHTCRRNANLTQVVENNQIYALTKGQYSPTSEPGFKTTTSPDGPPESPVAPLAIAFCAGATFVARGFAGDAKGLARLIAAGIQHRGHALIDVLQPCVAFNKVNTYEWYRERIYDAAEEGHDPTDRRQAWEKVQEWGERIPVGVLYREEGRPTLEDRTPALEDGAPARWDGEKLADEAFAALQNAFV